MGPAEAPDDIYSLDITGKNLKFVLEDDLSMFTKLQVLKAGENALPLARLGVLPNLRRLIFPCNGVTCLDLDLDGRFKTLEVSSSHLDAKVIQQKIAFGFVL